MTKSIQFSLSRLFLSASLIHAAIYSLNLMHVTGCHYIATLGLNFRSENKPHCAIVYLFTFSILK